VPSSPGENETKILLGRLPARDPVGANRDHGRVLAALGVKVRDAVLIAVRTS